MQYVQCELRHRDDGVVSMSKLVSRLRGTSAVSIDVPYTSIMVTNTTTTARLSPGLWRKLWFPRQCLISLVCYMALVDRTCSTLVQPHE